jgi:hypothetical protein
VSSFYLNPLFLTNSPFGNKKIFIYIYFTSYQEVFMFLLFFLFSTICSFATVLDTGVTDYFGYSNSNGNQLVVYSQKSVVGEDTLVSDYYTYLRTGGVYSDAATFPSPFYSYGAMDPSGNVLIIDPNVKPDWNLYFFNGSAFNTTAYNPEFSSSFEGVQNVIVKSNRTNNFQVVFTARYSSNQYKGTLLDQEQIVYLNIDTSSGEAHVTNQQIINQKKSLIRSLHFNLDPSSNILIAYADSISYSAYQSGKINLAYKNFSDTSFTKTSYPLSISNGLVGKAMNNFSIIKTLKGLNQQGGGGFPFPFVADLYVNYNTLSSNAPWSLSFAYRPTKNLVNLSFNQTNFSSGTLSTILNGHESLKGPLSSGNGGTLFFWWQADQIKKEITFDNYSLYDFNQKSTLTTQFSQNYRDSLVVQSVAARNNSFFTGYTNFRSIYFENGKSKGIYPLTLLLTQINAPSKILGVVNPLKLFYSPPQLFPKTDTSTYVIYLDGNNNLISEVYGN